MYITRSTCCHPLGKLFFLIPIALSLALLACNFDKAGVPIDDAGGGAMCGDGIRNGDEQCDTDDLAGQQCTGTGGVLACTDSCMFDVSGCDDAPANWYQKNWPYRRSITILSTSVGQDLSQFPVLVSLDGADIMGKPQASGNDIVFVSSDGQTVFAHEIEHYDHDTGELDAWVNVPMLSSSQDTVLYVYYGNPSSDDQQQPDLVWDASFQGVWHLSENAADESNVAEHRDSSGYGNHGLQSGNQQTPGRIAQAQFFDGNDDDIRIANSTNFVLGDANCTISAWIRSDDDGDRGIVIKSPPQDHAPGDKLFGINHTQDSLGLDHGWVGYIDGNSVVNDNQWHHVVWVQRADYDDNQERWELWVDGEMEGEQEEATNPDVDTHTLRIGGASPNSYFSQTFFGAIDEVRISHTDRSGAWIRTSYINQSNPTSFFSLGDEESLITPDRHSPTLDVRHRFFGSPAEVHPRADQQTDL